MPELIALARIGTPDGGIVVEGGTFTTDDENADVLVARGDAEHPKVEEPAAKPEKPAKQPKPEKDAPAEG